MSDDRLFEVKIGPRKSTEEMQVPKLKMEMQLGLEYVQTGNPQMETMSRWYRTLGGLVL